MIELLVTALVMFIAPKFIPGIHVDGFGSALIAAILFSLVNFFIGGLLRILTLPINFLTLGLCSFLIGVTMIYMVGKMFSGFRIDNFSSALILALLLVVAKIIFNKD